MTVVEDLLSDRSYYIEFNTEPDPTSTVDRWLPSPFHLTNHAKHAVVALAGLGASPEKIQAYYDSYTRLTAYGYVLEAPKPSEHAISEHNWREFAGQRTSFAGYCEFFDRKEKELGLDQLLRRYVPPLLAGWVGAFTHATIHLGWALDAGNRWMTIEGLAYMAFTSVSCHPERSVTVHGDERPVDSLLRIADAWDDSICDWVESLIRHTASAEAAGVHPDLAGLQYRIARVLAEGHPLIYSTPAWVDDCGWDELYYAVTLLYLAAPGDFVLLHLITSLHAMEHIADRLPADQQKHAVKCYWIGILCTLFSGMNLPQATDLAALHAIHQDAVDPADQNWDEVVGRALDEDEEHNPKLVYVLRRAWRRSGGRSIYRAAAAHFTGTPEATKKA